MMYGGRTSMIVGFAAALVAMLVGGGIGLLAGYPGGGTDVALMRITDYFLVIPDLVLMIVVATVFGPSLSHVILVIGLLLWTTTARIVRAQVKSIRERVYVKRARSLGASHRRIVFATRPATGGAAAHRDHGPHDRVRDLRRVGAGVPGRGRARHLVGNDARARVRTHGDDPGRMVGLRAAGSLDRTGRRRLLPDGSGDRGRAQPALARRAPVDPQLALPRHRTDAAEEAAP